MKLVSPLPLDICRANLKEQVGVRPFTRIGLFRKWTTRVTGEVTDTSVVLESTLDLFSKRFNGKLSPTPHGCILEGEWHTPFWSHIWGSPKSTESEIFEFLHEYGRFEKTA
jgi:hypothetical protein